MKKESIFWSILSIMMVAMQSVGLSSCSKDDDDNGGGASYSGIVGTWHRVSHECWEYEKGVLVDHSQESLTSIRSFEVVKGKETGNYRDYNNVEPEWIEQMFGADGTFATYANGVKRVSGTYSISNDSINCVFGVYSTTAKYSFEGDQLVLTGNGYKGDELITRNIEYYDRGAYPDK
jgi:hypothetical protein